MPNNTQARIVLGLNEAELAMIQFALEHADKLVDVEWTLDQRVTLRDIHKKIVHNKNKLQGRSK